MIGGLVLGLVESLAVWRFDSNYRDVYVFAVLLVVLVVRPRGIMGERTSDKV
jgi:branched-chain amino acid transport system permease protein